VVSVTVGGAPLDLDAVYLVATNDFMANGGDGYTVFTEGRMLITPIDAVLMASTVIDYVAAAGTVSPTVEGRITFR
jgi:2',3'-cyclic-nucleotide 2'-phosphodiesterase (5'-nucleotidase family)